MRYGRSEPIVHVGATVAAGTDRFIYVFMAVLFIVTAVIGFMPTSSALLAAVAAGARPPPPPILHLHAASMAAWLALLLMQTGLAATGRTALHRKLGMASLIAAPAVVVSLSLLSIRPIVNLNDLSEIELAQLWAQAGPALERLWAFFLTQLRAIFLFALFAGWAFAVRRTDTEMHKRMMIIASSVPLNAAMSRIIGSGWLPGTVTQVDHLLPDLYAALLLVPALIYDVIRRGRPHRAYLIGLALLVSTMIAVRLSSDADWWLSIGRKVMGGPIA